MTMPSRIKRPRLVESRTVRVDTGCGHAYITIGLLTDRPFELFATLGKTGGCAASNLEAIGRCISIGLQFGIPADIYISHLSSIKCPSPSPEATSCAEAISKALQEIMTSLQFEVSNRKEADSNVA
jgi:ribonucleoside-diphosphate reductase alpha chain